MEKINFSAGIIDDSSGKKLIKELSSNAEILKLLRDKNIPEEEAVERLLAFIEEDRR